MHDTCLHWECDTCLHFQPRKPSSRFELFQRELRKFNIKTSNKLKGGCSKGRISLRPHTKRHCEGHHLVRQYQLIAALAHFQRSMPIMGQGRSELVLTELRALRYDPPPSPVGRPHKQVVVQISARIGARSPPPLLRGRAKEGAAHRSRL
jgi:hypothetical protein